MVLVRAEDEPRLKSNLLREFYEANDLPAGIIHCAPFPRGVVSFRLRRHDVAERLPFSSSLSLPLSVLGCKRRSLDVVTHHGLASGFVLDPFGPFAMPLD